MWIVAVLLGIFLFFVLLLAIPLDLAFHIEKEEAFRSRIRVKWLFGLIGKNVVGGKKKPDKAKEKKKEKKERKLKSLLEMWKARGFLPKVLRFIKDVFRLLNIRELKLYLRVGLDDPADTGMLFAVAGSATLFLRRYPSLDIQIEPDFERENLRGHLQGELRLIPIKFIRPVVRLVFSITTLRAIKIMIGARRK
ncbi:DUF2953 domain-containing protein [Chloroflexota bacterium]